MTTSYASPDKIVIAGYHQPHQLTRQVPRHSHITLHEPDRFCGRNSLLGKYSQPVVSRDSEFSFFYSASPNVVSNLRAAFLEVCTNAPWFPVPFLHIADPREYIRGENIHLCRSLSPSRIYDRMYHVYIDKWRRKFESLCQLQQRATLNFNAAQSSVPRYDHN